MFTLNGNRRTWSPQLSGSVCALHHSSQTALGSNPKHAIYAIQKLMHSMRSLVLIWKKERKLIVTRPRSAARFKPGVQPRSKLTKRPNVEDQLKQLLDSTDKNTKENGVAKCDQIWQNLKSFGNLLSVFSIWQYFNLLCHTKFALSKF